MSAPRIMHLRTATRAPMSARDIIAYSPDEQTVLVVEIKSGKEDTPEQLERSRRQLMADAASLEAAFLLLAQRNGLFLWKKDAAPGTKAEFASVKSVLRDYASSVADQAETLRKPEMEMVVHSWLDDLAIGIRTPKADSEADQLLVRTGVSTIGSATAGSSSNRSRDPHSRNQFHPRTRPPATGFTRNSGPK